MDPQDGSRKKSVRSHESGDSGSGLSLPFHTIQPASSHSLFSEDGEPRRRMPSPTMMAIAQAHIRPHLPNPLPNPLSYNWQQDQGPWSPIGLQENAGASNVEPGTSILSSNQASYGPYSRGPSGAQDSVRDSAYETGSTISSSERSGQSQGHQAGKSRMDRKRPPEKRRRTSPPANSDETCSCHHCGYGCRLPSELKKHMLRHEKPHLCDISGCERNSNGFTTINDLERHKKSRHGIMPPGSKVYRCASESCVEKNKTWPRLDNFRQHCDRMHKNEDTQELIERSEISADNCGPLEQYNSGLVSPAFDFSFSSPSVPSSSTQTQTSPTSYRKTSTVSWAGLPSRTMSSGSASWTSNPIDEGFGSQFDPAESHPLDIDDLDIHPSATTEPAFHTSHGSFDARASLSSIGGSLHSPVSSMELPFMMSPEISPDFRSLPDKSPASSSSGPTRRISGIGHGHDDSPTDACASPDAYDYRLAPLEHSFGQLLHDIPGRVTDVTQAPASSYSLPSQKGDHKRRNRDVDEESFSPNRVVGPIEKMWERGSGEAGLAECKVPKLARPAEPLKCPMCPKIVQRHCDMKKHVARHERPFGCTYETCLKKFGSKNDWKRHEHTQHYQERLKSFWCGFCQRDIRVDPMNAKPWEDRFHHISIHYREGMRVDSWVLMDGHSTKGDLEKEQLAEAARSN